MSSGFRKFERNLNVMLQRKFYSGHYNLADLRSSKLTYAKLYAGKAVANNRSRLAITSGKVFEVL